MSRKGFIQDSVMSGYCFRRLPGSGEKSPGGKKMEAAAVRDEVFY